MSNLKYKLIAFLFFSLVLGNLNAQKVALVLSGGGAKGIAHAGVIKVLEENNIPIDYVVGTSMGSVVGGFYAAGYTPDEITSLAASQTMQDWIDGVIDEKYVYSNGEPSYNPAWLSLKFDFDSNFKPQLDPSFDRDYVLNINLAEQLEHAYHASNADFDSLFVPFRAVASNIFTENEVVLDSGILYEAVRASMAIPLIYKPIRLDGKLMFDGGVYNNFPVSVADEEFSPDVIIGVNVGSKVLEEYPKNDDEKLIAESILYFMLDKANPSDLDSTDVFIDVDLDDFSSLGFDRAGEIYEIGYQAALKQLPEILKKISRRSSQSDIGQRRAAFKARPKKEKFDTLIVEDYRGDRSKYISKVLNRRESFDFEQAKKAYFRLIDDDFFINIFPSYSMGDQYSFRLKGKPNPRLKASLGGSLTSRNISFLYLGVEFKRLSSLLEEYTAKVFMGPFYESLLLKSKYTLPGRRQVFFSPHFIINHRDFLNLSDYLLGEPDLTILDRVDLKTGIIMGVPLSRKFGLYLDASYFDNRDKFNNISRININEEFDQLELKGGRFEIKITHNSLNFPQFAHKGSRLEGGINYFIAHERYTPGITPNNASALTDELSWYRMKLSGEKYFEIGKKFSLGAELEVIYSNQPGIGTVESSLINSHGYYPLMDSRTLFLENFKSRKYAAAGIKNVWMPKKNLQFRLEGYAFNSFERIIGENGDEPIFENNSFNPSYSATLGVMYQSIVGPIGVHGNYYDDEQHQWGILFHLGYLLFNRHSLE